MVDPLVMVAEVSVNFSGLLELNMPIQLGLKLQMSN